MNTASTTRARVEGLEQHGACAHVARILGMSTGAVSRWRKHGVPSARVGAVRAALEAPRRVHVEELQPRAACAHVAQVLGVHKQTVAAWRRLGVQARHADEVRAALTTYTPPAPRVDVADLHQSGACAHVVQVLGVHKQTVAAWRKHGVPSARVDEVRAALTTYTPPAPRVDVADLHQGGACSHVARILGVTMGAVSQWRKHGVPSARVGAVRAALATLGAASAGRRGAP